MRVSVVRLRRLGQVLTRSQLNEPTVGDLLIDDWPAQSPKGRWRRRAGLQGRQYGLVRLDLLRPLFDVQVLKLDESGLYIQGVEIDSSDSHVSEHVQVWLCRPTNQELSVEGPAQIEAREQFGAVRRQP